MKQSKNKKTEIVLLNSEGPLLKAKKTDNGEYALYDQEDSIIDVLLHEEFIDFIYNSKPVTGNDGNPIIYSSYPRDMKPEKEDIEIFIKGLPTFLSFKGEDGQWISPIAEEREWQEDVLKELFPSYPNGAPKWQYMNGLLQIALRYKEQIEIDHGNSFDDEELEDDENG